jgi:type II secretory pathway pseudopilin PulG
VKSVAKKSFTFVELLIVVALLGILAAMTLPIFQEHITEAKEAAAKDNLRILRNAIGLYAAQHNGFPPGYVNEALILVPVTVTKQFCQKSNISGKISSEPSAEYNLGPYLSAIPKNPFNNSNNMLILNDFTPFPEPATGTTGWIYKPSTKTIRLNFDGTDSEGVRYYDY